jgi:hypothetical protein
MEANMKGLGSWIVVIVLLSLLAATGVDVYRGLTIGDGAVPVSGYVAMALGVIFCLVIGFGLMALLFYSSRRGYDEPAVLIRNSGSDLGDAKNNPEAK